MESFFNELSTISPFLPVVIKWIIVAVAVLLAWLILSIPCYWLYRACEPFCATLTAFLAVIRGSLAAIAHRLFLERGTPIERFIDQHAISLVLGPENARIVREIRAVGRTLKAVPKNIDNLERSLSDAQKTSRDSIVTAQRLKWPEAEDPPKASEFNLIQAEANDAWLQAVVFGIFATALIVINTLMLREFFGSFIPPIVVLGIVQLPLVVSCIFSIVEMIFGASLAFVTGSSAGAMSAKLLLVVLIAMLGAIEAGFYGKFGADFGFDPFAVFWTPSPSPGWEKMWFGIFGPLVVFGMAFAGDRWLTAMRILWRLKVIRNYRKFLCLRTRRADQFKQALDDAGKSYGDLNRALKLVADSVKTTAEELSAGNRYFVESKTGLERVAEGAIAINLNPFVELNHSEMLRAFYRYIFHAVAIVVAFALIALAFGAFGFTAPITVGNVTLPGIAIAVGEATLMLAAGTLLDSVSGWHPGAEPSVSPILGTVLSYVVVTSAIVGNAVAFVDRGTLVDFVWFAFASAAAIWLMLVGSRIGWVIAAMWALVQAAAMWLASAIVFVAAAIVIAFKVIIHLLINALALLCFPLAFFILRKARDERILASSAATSLLAIVFLGAACPHAGFAQGLSQEPKSSIYVLVDLSGTWLAPASDTQDRNILRTVSDAIASIAYDVEAPIAVRYLPIGDLSLAREPLCQTDFTPKLLKGANSSDNELTNLQDLRQYLGDTCARLILARKPQPYTDITGALDGVSRAIAEQSGAFKAIIVLSDLKEERRRNQKEDPLHLSGTRTLLLYRILDEDRLDPTKVDARISVWKKSLGAAGSTVYAINDISASAAQIARVLTQ